jgi:hypothetical protein
MKKSQLRARAGETPGWSWRLMRRTRRLLLFICVCTLVSTTPRPVDARDGESVEYRAKLASIYSLAKFVEWPPGSFPDPGAPLKICIVGTDPFSPDLEDELRARMVGGHPVEIRALRPGDVVGTCNIVFFPLAANDQASSIVKALERSSTLTIGETEGFATRGGIINFTVNGNRLHFEVNPRAAERSGLKLSSQLLGIATIIKER